MTTKGKKIPRLIALIGFMGSGKSTIGRLLAIKVGYKFIDLDTLIQNKTGKTIPEIFKLEGEGKFREYETEVLWSQKDNTNAIISTGGGAPITSANRRFFKENVYTIFLNVTLDEVLKRTGKQKERPLLNQPREELESLYNYRLPIYLSLANLVIQTDKKTPLEICQEILEAF